MLSENNFFFQCIVPTKNRAKSAPFANFFRAQRHVVYNILYLSKLLKKTLIKEHAPDEYLDAHNCKTKLMSSISRFLKKTSSICPVCHAALPATIYEECGEIYIRKICPQHGEHVCLVEKDADLYKKLMGDSCKKHVGQYHSIMINITHRYNLACPICYLPERTRQDQGNDRMLLGKTDPSFRRRADPAPGPSGDN